MSFSWPAIAEQEPHSPAPSSPNHEANDKTGQQNPAKTFWQRTLDDPIATYTFALAVFSGVLLIVSTVQIGFLIRADKTGRIAADAAKQTADASLGVELPRFELRTAGITSRHNPVEMALFLGDMTVILQNHGRTTAHIVKDCIAAAVCLALPPEPRYPPNDTRDAPLGSAIQASEPYKINCKDRLFLTKEDAQAAVTQKKNFFLFGYVAYRDFLGGHWRSKFCVIFDSSPSGYGGFVDPKTYPAYTGHERYDPSKSA